jgi:CAAX protease family protein
MMTIQWRKIVIYFAVAFLWAYGSVAIFLLLGGSFQSAAWLKLASIAMLGPGLAALFLQRFIYREPVRQTLAVELRPNRWWGVAWFAPLPICFATLGVSLLLPGHRYDPSMQGIVDRALATAEQHAKLMELSNSSGLHPLLLLLLPMLLLAPTAGMIGGVGEELGWRGLLYRETESLGFVHQCFLIGPMWYLWHAPLPFLGSYGYQGHPFLGSLALFGQILLQTPLFNYVRLRSGSSLAAGLLHSALGAAAVIAVAPVKGGSGLSTGISSFSYCAVLLVANLALLLYDRFIAKEPVIARRAVTQHRASQVVPPAL